MDNSSTNIKLLVSQLLHQGKYQVNVVNTLDEALTFHKKIKPLLILLSSSIPDHDGLSPCAILRNEPSLTNVPIILLTQNKKVQLSGADDFISIPYSSRETLARIETYIQLKKSRDLLKEKTAGLEKST